MKKLIHYINGIEIPGILPVEGGSPICIYATGYDEIVVVGKTEPGPKQPQYGPIMVNGVCCRFVVRLKLGKTKDSFTLVEQWSYNDNHKRTTATEDAKVLKLGYYLARQYMIKYPNEMKVANRERRDLEMWRGQRQIDAEQKSIQRCEDNINKLKERQEKLKAGENISS